MIANAVDLPGHPAISRARACDLAPDSDLGPRRVTTGVGALTLHECETALAASQRVADRLIARGLIHAAYLSLGGSRVTAPTGPARSCNAGRS